MLSTFRARHNCDQEAKYVQNRIIITEKIFAELSHIFEQYASKTGSLRAKTHELSKIIFEYSDSEYVSESLSLGLSNFGQCMSLLAAYGNLRVEGLNVKIVKELSLYEDICKSQKDVVKEIYKASEREITTKRQLDRMKDRNPRNRQQIIQGEAEVVKASAEFTKTLRNLEEKSEGFEKQKLHDIKSILSDFIVIEMGYHAKALEVLTKAFQVVNAINEDADIQEFRNNWKSSTAKHSQGKSVLRSSKSLGNLFSGRSTNSTSLSRSEQNLHDKELPETDSSSEEETSESQRHRY